MTNAQADRIFAQALKHRSAIMAVIVAIVRNFDLAEDLFQDTMLEIVKSREKFDAKREFLPWARGIARNMAMRHFRDVSRRPKSVSDEMLDFIADIVMEDEPEEIWQLERAGLRHCMNRLPGKLQKLFQLRYAENLKGRSLADESGIRQTSLRTTLSRLRNSLRGCINTYLQKYALQGDGSVG